MATLVFAHIPKTAGTTISDALSALFDASTVTGHIDIALPASTEGLDFIATHFPFPQLERVEGEKVYVSCLREPVSRLKSIYRFWHSLSDLAAVQSGNPQVLDARRMTFDQFITADAPHLIEIVDNGMVRHFAEVSGRVGEADFSEACRAVDKLSAIVLYERLSETMAELYGRLNCTHRLVMKQLNVTSRNHEHDSVKYRMVADTDMGSMTPETVEKLIQATTYDLRLYNYAIMRRESQEYRKSSLSDKVHIRWPRLMAGETIAPSRHNQFIDLLCEGWTTPEDVLWTFAPVATLRFKIHPKNNKRLRQIKVRFSGCLIPRRDYMIGSVSADDGRLKSALFLNTDCTLDMAEIEGETFDMICVGAQTAGVTLDLADSPDPDFIHKIEFRCSGTSPPALLAYNEDNRPLGVRLEALKLL